MKEPPDRSLQCRSKLEDRVHRSLLEGAAAPQAVSQYPVGPKRARLGAAPDQGAKRAHAVCGSRGRVESLEAVHFGAELVIRLLQLVVDLIHRCRLGLRTTWCRFNRWHYFSFPK